MRTVNRLVIVLHSASPDRPELAAAPFVYALSARALELDVEMHFTGTSVRWLIEGGAADTFTDRARSKCVQDFLAETRSAGVMHFACSMAFAEHGGGQVLSPLATGVAGAATVVAAAIDPDTRVLVF